MTDNHDQADVPIDDIEQLDDLEATEPVETAVSMASEATRGATLSLAGGGVLLVAALRSLVRGKARAIPLGLAGAGMIRYGLGKRRSSEDEAPTFEPSTDAVESGTAGKETTDEASAAAGRAEDVDVDETGEIPAEAELDEEEGGSRVEFTEDEPGDREAPRPKPDLEDDDASDPRRTDDDADEPAEIDLSQSAMAEEASEAAGPSPEQAQPSQTDATEPEETPEEDASHMKVDPDDEDDASQDGGPEDETQGRRDGSDTDDPDTDDSGTDDSDTD